jgi:hypothetical protein
MAGLEGVALASYATHKRAADCSNEGSEEAMAPNE